MPTRVHLIGVCGTAMATLAALLKSKGFDVRGSDQNVYPPMSDFLVDQGITLLQGYKPEHIGADLDLVVVGNAISRGNPELEEVLDRKIRYCSLPEAVRDHFLWASRAVVITGTHGKTTTTALTGWILTDGGADPSMLVGGIVENFDGSYRVGGGREFVIEGDEYDSAFFDKTAKFLKYLPDIAVVGNIEFDHADIYPNLDAIRLTFQRFVNLIPRRGLLLLGADNADALSLRARAHCRVETFGVVGRGGLAGARCQGVGDVDQLQRQAARRAGRHVRDPDARHVQRPQRTRRDRGRRGRRARHGHHGGVAAALQGYSAAASASGHRARRRGVRRLRASPDGDCRDARRRAFRASRTASVGRVRAAIGDLVPPDLPG